MVADDERDLERSEPSGEDDAAEMRLPDPSGDDAAADPRLPEPFNLFVDIEGAPLPYADHYTMARLMFHAFRKLLGVDPSRLMERMVSDRGEFWVVMDERVPVWTRVPVETMELRAGWMSGYPVFDGVGKDGEPKTKALRLKESDARSAVRVLGTFMAKQRFFEDAPRGVACGPWFFRVNRMETPLGAVVSLVREDLGPQHRVVHHVAELPFQHCMEDGAAAMVAAMSAPPPSEYADGSPYDIEREWVLRAITGRLTEADAEADDDVVLAGTAWGQFLEQVLPDRGLQRLLGEYFGACLMGCAMQYQRSLWLYGSGGNGKGTLINVLKSFFPKDSITALMPQMLDSEYNRASLSLSLVNLVSEVKREHLADTAHFKAAVSGNDTMTGRWPTGRPFNFVSKAGWVISSNELPTVSDSTHGFWRRQIVIPFEQSVDGVGTNPNIEADLLEERDVILSWMILGAARLVRRGRFIEPAAATDAKALWRQEADSVATWFAEYLVKDDNGRMRAMELFRDYTAFASDCRYFPVSIKEFGARMKTLCRHKRETAGIVYYVKKALPKVGVDRDVSTWM